MVDCLGQLIGDLLTKGQPFAVEAHLPGANGYAPGGRAATSTPTLYAAAVVEEGQDGR